MSDTLSPLHSATEDYSLLPSPLPPQPVLGQPWTQVAYQYPMRVGLGKVRGTISDFRDGILLLSENGVTVQGKALYSTLTRLLIYIPTLLLGIGILVIYLLLEYVYRRDLMLLLSWDNVEEFVLETRKQRVCMVYHLPGKPRKPISLAFSLQIPGMYDNFVAAARYFAPTKVREGKILPPTALGDILIVFGIIGLIFGLIIYFGSTH